MADIAKKISKLDEKIGKLKERIESDTAECENKQSNLKIQRYFAHSFAPNRVNCIVSDNTNTIAHKVCKIETGKNYVSFSTDTASVYRYTPD